MATLSKEETRLRELIQEQYIRPYQRKRIGTKYLPIASIEGIYVKHHLLLREALRGKLKAFDQPGDQDQPQRPVSSHSHAVMTISETGMENRGLEEVDLLQRYVIFEAKKLYTILLLLYKPGRIVEIYNQRFHLKLDDSIFGKFRNGFGPQCFEIDLQSTPVEDIACDIVKTQWELPPTFLEHFHGNFLGDLRFPFLAHPSYVGKGGYGIVERVKVAEGHLKADGYSPGDDIVYKKVKEQDSVDYEDMLQEVKTLQKRKHDNLVPLYASFTACDVDGYGSSNTSHRFIYMFYPYSRGGDMEAWLMQKNAPSHLVEIDDRHQAIYTAMQHTISGLAHIHREIDGEFAHHHDIKPKNILLFERNGQPCWKICDFGNAKLQRVTEESGIEQRHGQLIGTYPYIPPEYFTGDDAGNRRLHGRLFDVYSLGCVHLELATVHTYGWTSEGLPRFKDLRLKNHERDRKAHVSSLPYDTRSKEDGKDTSFHNNMKVVSSWITELEAKNNGNDKACKALKLIKEMLEERNKRVFSWEVYMDMFDLFSNGESTEGELQSVVQPFKESPNWTVSLHDPLMRAEHNQREKWWTDLLKSKGWTKENTARARESIHRRTRSSPVGKPLSTLSSADLKIHNNLSTSIRRKELQDQIQKGFKRSDRCALYGIAGVGKSHAAHQFAEAYTDSNCVDKKHVFWINAASKFVFTESMEAIAAKVAEKQSSAEDNYRCVRDWLIDKANGSWLMVVDNLEDKDMAEMIRRHLPIYSGYVLFTTRNRELLSDLVPFQNEPCIQVQNLPLDRRRTIFSNIIQSGLEKTARGKPLDDLIEFLYLPELICKVAQYLNEHDKTVASFWDDLRGGDWSGLGGAISKRRPGSDSKHQILKFYEDTVLSHIVSLHDEHMRLGVISCLDRHIPLGIIERFCGNEEKLTTLKHLSLIRRNSDRSYTMLEFTRNAVRYWFEKSKGVSAVLNLHREVLRILLEIEEARRREPQSNICRFELLPHLECFLEFTKASDMSPDFQDQVCDVVIRAVHRFSKLYFDNNRYKDAIAILTFTFTRILHSKHRLALGRSLVKAHILSASAASSADQKSQAEERLIQMLEATTKDDPGWCEVQLEYASFHNKFSEPVEAYHRLKELPTHLRLSFEQSLPRLNGEGVPSDFRDKKRRKLAIRLRHEEGITHLAGAKNTIANPTKILELEKAARMLDEAKAALLHWSNNNEVKKDEDWLQEIEEDLATVWLNEKTADALQKAEKYWQERVKVNRKYHKKTGCGIIRLWDVECKLAQILIQSESREVQQSAVQKLGTLLQDYERACGDESGHTLRCAKLLYRAHDVVGDQQAADVLRLKYELGSADC